jgi:Ca2+-binding RTX toxin-like protein
VRRLLACAFLAAFAVPTVAGAPAATSASSGTWQGTATGVQNRTRHHDDQTSPNVVWDDSQHYQVRLQFTFTIDSGGTITGKGTGSYDAATWHIAGVNEHAAQDNPPKDPHFSCDPPITGKPFKVVVGGSATANRVTLSLAIPEAAEVGDDYDCGADFTGFASTSHYMTQSLTDVGGNSISFDRSSPHVPTLTRDVPINTGKSVGHAVSTWTIHLTAPRAGGSGGSGGSSAPTKSGNPPKRSACSVTGTAHADVLNGTSGDDVICGFGGNDVIRGRGGNDVIYAGSGNDRVSPGSGRDVVSAGPGRDRITAHDGTRDRIDGGSGRDSATVDRGRDDVTHVERVS